MPEPGWLEGMLRVAEEESDFGVAGGQILNPNGLLHHIGLAFDVNQSPFSIYRMMPPDFGGAVKQREFDAVEFPLLVSRELYCRLGGFNVALANRFEDIDFCLSVKQAGLRVLYTPSSVLTRAASSWLPARGIEPLNRISFYSKWTGSLWQNDAQYLREDGLTHDGVTALYRELAVRVAVGVGQLTTAAAEAAP